MVNFSLGQSFINLAFLFVFFVAQWINLKTWNDTGTLQEQDYTSLIDRVGGMTGGIFVITNRRAIIAIGIVVEIYLAFAYFFYLSQGAAPGANFTTLFILVASFGIAANVVHKLAVALMWHISAISWGWFFYLLTWLLWTAAAVTETIELVTLTAANAAFQPADIALTVGVWLAFLWSLLTLVRTWFLWSANDEDQIENQASALLPTAAGAKQNAHLAQSAVNGRVTNLINAPASAGRR